MKQISLKLLGALLVNQKNNPFHPMSEINKLKDFMEWDEDEKEMIGAFEFFHSVYMNAVYRVLEALKTTKYDRKEIIEGLFSKASIHMSTVNSRIIESIVKGNVANDMERLKFMEIDTAVGGTGRAGQAIEIVGDIYNLILEEDRKYGLLSYDVKGSELKEVSIDALVQHLTLAYNMILNVKSGYERIVYGRASLETRANGDMLIGHGESTDLIQLANEIRHMSHFNEFFFPSFHFLKKFGKKDAKIIKNISVSNGRIMVETGKGNSDHEMNATLATMIQIFYPHLMEMEFDCYDKLGLEQLLNIVQHISALSQYISGRKKTSLNVKDAAYYMDRTDLCQYLSEMTGIDTSTVSNVVFSLTQPKEEPIDLFRYPIFIEETRVLFLLPVLHAPVYSPFVERWLEKAGMHENEHDKLFFNFVKSDLGSQRKSKTNKGYWKVRADLSIDSSSILTLETANYLLVIMCKTFRYCFEADEEFDFRTKAHEAFKSLKDEFLPKIIKEGKAKGKEVLKLCITPYVNFSGATISGITMFDLTLLNNYLASGKFMKVKLIDGNAEGKIKDFFTYRYYENEKEFNDNLRPFIDRPAPIYNIIDRLELREIPVLMETYSPMVYTTISEMISVEKEAEWDLGDLDKLLKTQFFIESENARADQMINQLLSKIFTKLADSNKPLLDDIFSVVEAIKMSKRISAGHLAIYIILGIERIKTTKIAPEKKFAPTSFSEKEISLILEKYTDYTKIHKLSDFEFSPEMTSKEREQLFSFLIASLSNLTRQNYSLAQLKDIYLQVIYARSLADTDQKQTLASTAISNFIEALNFNFDYQTAREVAQESLTAARKPNEELLALSTLFKCYLKQKNILAAGVIGGILVSKLDSLGTVVKETMIDMIFTSMRFFRDFGYTEFAAMAWKAAKKFKPHGYDEDKLTLTYFASRVNAGLNGDKNLIEAICKYVKKNFDRITRYGDKSISPWYSLLSAIERHAAFLKIKLKDDLIEYKKVFEKQLKLEDPDTFENIDFQVNGNSKDIQNDYIEALVKTYQAELFDDFKYDIINLKPLSDNVFVEAISKNDYNLLLLTSLAYNDQHLIYLPDEDAEDHKVFGHQHSRFDRNRLENYWEFLSLNLQLQPGQLLIWLVELQGRVFSILIDSSNAISHKELPHWNPGHMAAMLYKKLPKMYFNSSKNKYYDLGEQEKTYSELAKSLISYDLDIKVDFDELLVVKSVDLASYPDNLLMNGGDLISRTKPVCNIVNIEFFLANNSQDLVTELKINAWLPKRGQDGTISFGHDALAPLFNVYPAAIFDSPLPVNIPFGNINIFMAHGTRGLDGFKYFEAQQHTYLYDFSPFGSGDVAVLFICNSGSTTEDFQAQEIRSIGQSLLLQGYKSVIAPFWQYDVTMSYTWLKEFMEVIKDGYSLNQCVHLANRKVSEYDMQTGQLFYEPGGWAAMHLYGNPNLKFKL